MVAKTHPKIMPKSLISWLRLSIKCLKMKWWKNRRFVDKIGETRKYVQDQNRPPPETLTRWKMCRLPKPILLGICPKARCLKITEKSLIQYCEDRVDPELIPS